MRSTIPRVLAVSGDRSPGPSRSPAAWRRWCSDLAAAGVDALQLRVRGAADGELLALARLVRESSPPATRILVNRRLDVVLAAGADGLHLPSDGVPAAAARGATGPGLLLGRSTHEVEEVAALAAEGAVDYVIFGPVFETPSKRGLLAARGLERLAAACAPGLPVVAIGGIDASNARAALAAGAAGVAAIRACAEAGAARRLVAATRAGAGVPAPAEGPR